MHLVIFQFYLNFLCLVSTICRLRNTQIWPAYSKLYVYQPCVLNFTVGIEFHKREVFTIYCLCRRRLKYLNVRGDTVSFKIFSGDKIEFLYGYQRLEIF